MAIDKGLLFSGDVFLKKSGNTGFTEIGNMINFAYTKEGGETKQRLSKKTATFGQVISEIHTPSIPQISMTSDTFNEHNLTLLFMGESSDLTVVAASVVAESVDLVENQWVELANQNITAASVVIATKTEGTDFSINYIYGLIQALNTATAATQSVDYDHGGITGGYTIKGATINSVDGELLFMGRNLDGAENVKFSIPSVSLKAEGDFDFFGGDFAQLTLKGSMKIATGLDTPFLYHNLTALS